IRFVGRADDVVKVRGFRVDLVEVERALCDHPAIAEGAVVLRRPAGGESSLTAFVSPRGADAAELREHLASRLPSYMCPWLLVPLERLPRMPNGKIDRRLLATMELPGSGAPALRELGESEARIRRVWEDVLGHAQFDEDQSFFEVGGTSLSVFTLVQRLRGSIPEAGPLATVVTVYRHPTVRGLAEQLAGSAGDPEGDSALEAGSMPVAVPLRTSTADGGEPLFLVASAGGTLGAYQHLVRALRVSRPVVGLRDPFLWDDRDPAAGFADWVGRYLSAIRERQPEGPYYIVAYSSAGAFGYELARLLRSDGEDVSLTLIDPLALDRASEKRFGHWALRATYMRPWFRALVRWFGRLRQPFVRAALSRSTAPPPDWVPGVDLVRQVSADVRRSASHLTSLAALMELNTGLPLALDDAAFEQVPPERYVDVLVAHVVETM